MFSDIFLPDEIQLWFRIEVDYNLFAGIFLFDTKRENEFSIGSQLDVASVKDSLHEYLNLDEAQYEWWWVRYWYLPTAYGSTKLEKDKIPNFKEMNDAAIVLSDSDTRKKFVEECISIIDRELHRLIK